MPIIAIVATGVSIERNNVQSPRQTSSHGGSHST
jgi:hypothetical protein